MNDFIAVVVCLIVLFVCILPVFLIINYCKNCYKRGQQIGLDRIKKEKEDRELQEKILIELQKQNASK